MTNTCVETPTHATRFPADEELHYLKHVRLYGYSPGVVALQVRSLGKITNHGKVQFAVVSHALLDVTAAVELYAALGEWIEEQPQQSTA